MVKYYFADFVRKGGRGVPSKSVTPILPKILSVKGEGGVPPKSVTFFVVFDPSPNSDIWKNKLASLEATLVRNSAHSLAYSRG